MIPSLDQTGKSLESEQNLRGPWAPERSFGFHFNPQGVRKGPQMAGMDIASQAWIKSLMWCLRAQAALSAKKRHLAPSFLLSTSLHCAAQPIFILGWLAAGSTHICSWTGPRGARCPPWERNCRVPTARGDVGGQQQAQGVQCCPSCWLRGPWSEREDLWLKFRQTQSSVWSTAC